MDAAKKIYIFLILVALVVVLIYAQSVIIPFILAILFWFLIRVIKKVMSKVRFIGKLPEWLLTVFSSVLLLSFLFLIGQMITVNIGYLKNTLPIYEQNVNKITQIIQGRFNIDLSNWLNNLAEDMNFGGILSRIFSTLTSLFGNTFTVMIYLIFLLLEEHIFPQKVKAMYPDIKHYEKMNALIQKIDHLVSNYIAIKTMASLLTGFLSYIVLMIIGVDAPFFWAFLIFILNFIPTIGSLVATIFPAIFALLQFGEFAPAIFVLAFVGSIQLVVGNFIEPRIMGTSLNISPLVVFLTLMLWGMMWGIPGMLLSVPITVILIIIMSEFPGTRPIAILLSRFGKINE